MENILYDRIGTDYDSTRTADPYLASRLLALLQPSPGGRYIDIGCGTGNYTRYLAAQGITITGIDPSLEMLEKARNSAPAMEWLQAGAEELPFGDESCDGAVATLTIHHWSELHRAFAEISRVLKPGSRLVIFSSTPGQMEGYWLRHYFPRMLEDSMRQMPSPERIGAALEGTALSVAMTENYEIRPDLQDHFLYCGKNNPSLYLDENIRRGISSFAALANRQEVEEGLRRLEEDIRTAAIDDIRRSYANGKGDYCFICLEKQQAP